MRGNRPSNTAQYVAIVRAVLDGKGVIDDPIARSLLRPLMGSVAEILSSGPFRRRTSTGFYAALAARTLLFDGEVESATEAGICQVVTVGAGYDSRAWRLARPGVQFFEVDHPSTQADKRLRAPTGGPIYVPVDLRAASIIDALSSAALERERPALFLVEGVTMYLQESEVHSLLARLAKAAAPGSRLAVNFGAPRRSGRLADQWRNRARGAVGHLSGEPHLFLLGAADVGPFVARTGWGVERTVTLREVASQRLAATDLNIAGINPDASAVIAHTA